MQGICCRASSVVASDGAVSGTEGRRFDSCRARTADPALQRIAREVSIPPERA
jgi:hypothetical protein